MEVVMQSNMYPWAQQMAEVVHDVVPDADVGIFGMGGQDGEAITKEQGERLLQTFRARGYSTCGKAGDQFTVPHPTVSRVGVTVCFGEQYGIEPGWCSIFFYNENPDFGV